MKTTSELKTRIAKYFGKEVNKVSIGDSEIRENYKGKRLQNGRPVYVKMNTGIDNEEISEFSGWVINGRWYKIY
jgi:hypothetical protein